MKNEDHQINNAVENVLEYDVPFEKNFGNINEYVSRPDLEERLKKMIGLRQTILVHGVRGSGKTTAALKAIDGVKGAYYVKGEFTTFEGAARSALRRLNIISLQPRHAFDEFFTRLPQNKDMPTFVFDIDERWPVEEVQQLVLFAKKWGVDVNKATFILVFSAAFFYYRNIGMSRMGCIDVEVTEAKESDIIELFKKRLPGMFYPSQSREGRIL